MYNGDTRPYRATVTRPRRPASQGWLGMILGTRLWYGFLGADLADGPAFERQVGL